MDYYAASLSITYLAFFEVVAIAWFYGVGRLSRNIKQMTGWYLVFIRVPICDMSLVSNGHLVNSRQFALIKILT